jgi:hypothetical protein
VLFLLCSQYQRTAFVDFGGTSLCRKKALLLQGFLRSSGAMRVDGRQQQRSEQNRASPHDDVECDIREEVRRITESAKHTGMPNDVRLDAPEPAPRIERDDFPIETE